MRTSVVVLILLSCLVGSNSTPDRDRNKHSLSSSSNFDLMEHRFRHDIDDSDDHFNDHPGSHHDSDPHLHPHGACEPIKVGKSQKSYGLSFEILLACLPDWVDRWRN